MIARSHHDTGMRVNRGDMIGRPGDARRGVTARRLKQNLAFVEFGQLLPYQGGILFIGDNQHILLRHDGKHPVVAHLQQAPASAEEINKLFRTRRAAVRPETAADASAHYNTITMLVNHIVMYGLFS